MVIVRSFSQSESDLVDFSEMPRFSDDLGSASSSPFVSAPSSPGRGSSSGYFFSAPASPMHFVLYSAPSSSTTRSVEPEFLKHDSVLSPADFEFDFSSRLSSSSGPLGGGSMTSADELFSNGQIKPVKLSSHLQKPQILAPLLDLETEEGEDGDFQETKLADEKINRGRDLKLRSRSVHRKARSLSPLRNIHCEEEEEEEEEENGKEDESDRAKGVKECIRKLKEDYEEDETKRHENITSAETTPSCSASSSRSSSSGRNSMKWIFLKDLLHRSKSEGRGSTKEKFWSNISFSPSKDKKVKSQSPTLPKEDKPLPESAEEATNETQHQKQKPKQKQKQPTSKKSQAKGSKPTNGIAKRRRGQQPSAHEVHYTTNRAQSEEMKKRTYLPYRHGLFGCLGFSSKGYSALNGLARSLNTVSSR